MLGSKTREFLAQKMLFTCPECGAVRIAQLKDLGNKISCKRCGHIVEISNDITLDLDADDELRQDVEEYLKELKNSSSL